LLTVLQFSLSFSSADFMSDYSRLVRDLLGKETIYMRPQPTGWSKAAR
jgi:hypothetical protein